MRAWSTDHPKATLMTRKRAAILAAAKTSFLENGYAGTSMEAIAKSANVSIMTLYRHAKNKEDLFHAVISNACEPADDIERAALEGILAMPMEQALVESALHMQGTLIEKDSVALLRVVLAEAPRFPRLAELAYRGFVGRLESAIAWALSRMEKTAGLTEEERCRLGSLFVERIVGPELLRALLGLAGPTDADQRLRAERARDDLLREITKI